MSQQFESRRRRTRPVRRSPSVDQRPSGFKRSRTITGSKSSQVLAASEKRGFLTSSRLTVQSLKKHRTLLAGAVIVSWFMVGGTIFLLDQYISHPQFRTNELAMEPQLSVALESYAQEYFANRPLERFRFSLDQPQLRAYLSDKIPELEDIEIHNAAGLAANDALVTLRQPVAKWQLGEVTYYVDASGQAFERNYFSEPSVVVNDNSGLPPSDQRRLASRQLLHFIGQIVDGVNRSSRLGSVQEVIIPPASLKAIEITLEGEPYRVKLLTDRNIIPQVADMESAVSYLKARELAPRYIDLRVAGKAYYR